MNAINRFSVSLKIFRVDTFMKVFRYVNNNIIIYCDKDPTRTGLVTLMCIITIYTLKNIIHMVFIDNFSETQKDYIWIWFLF